MLQVQLILPQVVAILNVCYVHCKTLTLSPKSKVEYSKHVDSHNLRTRDFFKEQTTNI